MKASDIINNTKNELVIIGVSGYATDVRNFISENHKNDKISITVFCENENYLFAKTRLLDNNVSSKRYSFFELKSDVGSISDDLGKTIKSKNVNIEVCYIDIPIRIIKSDDKIYINNWVTIPTDDFVEVNKDDEQVTEFLSLMFNPEIGRKFVAPYWKENERVETIELYDENRIRRGIFPRSAFYDSDFIKLVVWVFIFDRNGKMLIHKRKANAKDNRGMWDKSVGGHADYTKDIDTSVTVPREVIEELKTNEINNTSLLIPNPEDVIFLGEWNPSIRYNFPFEEIKHYENQWIYFKIPKKVRTSSPRLLPNKTIKNNEVIADTYLFLLAKDDDIKDFKNSQFKLLDPNIIKSAIQNSDQGKKDENFNEKKLKFSPDIKYAFSKDIREDIETFSRAIKKNLNE